MILPNPYPDKESCHRVQADIPEAVFQQLLRTFPGHGNVQAIINTLIFDLIEDLNQANIKYYELERESLIRCLLIRRSTTPSPAQGRTPRADAGGSGVTDSNPPKRKSQRTHSDSSDRKGGEEKVSPRQKGKAAGTSRKSS